MTFALVDMHCHLDFLAHPAAFARAAAGRGMGFFCATVTPASFERAHLALGACGNVRVGIGLHPWWLADGRLDGQGVSRACELVESTRYVGEVGLDFGKRFAGSRDLQLAAFERVAAACACEGGKLLTVHAVRSADAVLDVLERTRCLKRNQVIFHWFSGSSEALWRAIRLGCFFSVNARMLATRRGREYTRLIPDEKLLVETDLPPESDSGFGLDDWEADMRDALSAAEKLRGRRLAEACAATSCRLLAW